MGGEQGLTVDLTQVPSEGVDREDTLLFSESAGRFIVTVAPDNQAAFEALFAGQPAACVGQVTEMPQLTINGLDGTCLAALPVEEMKSAWKGPFGDLI
jgi:phosphoribosylformylglycinamidine synthase